MEIDHIHFNKLRIDSYVSEEKIEDLSFSVTWGKQSSGFGIKLKDGSIIKVELSKEETKRFYEHLKYLYGE